MFTSTTTGDDFLDAELVNRSQLNAALLNYASNVALGQAQTSTTLALTRAEGNTTVLSALDQRITAELATKLTSSDLNPFATNHRDRARCTRGCQRVCRTAGAIGRRGVAGFRE